MGTSGSVRTTRWPAPLVLLAIGLLAAACNIGSGTAESTITSDGAVATTSHLALYTSTIDHGGQRAAAGTSPFYEVKTGTVSGLGTVLVNGQGLTLYMFVPDHQRGRSTCYNACASSWPPLRLPTGVTAPVAAGKAEVSLLGTTTRKDGGLEVTYNRWPLYLWVGDGSPGQATGQGINGSGGYWYVLSPKGGVIKAKAR
jgi:predicted lipoprotein with Yx(FWY)xxD motif